MLGKQVGLVGGYGLCLFCESAAVVVKSEKRKAGLDLPYAINSA